MYEKGDWTVVVDYNKVQILPKMRMNRCVLDVRDVEVRGQKRSARSRLLAVGHLCRAHAPLNRHTSFRIPQKNKRIAINRGDVFLKYYIYLKVIDIIQYYYNISPTSTFSSSLDFFNL